MTQTALECLLRKRRYKKALFINAQFLNSRGALCVKKLRGKIANFCGGGRVMEFKLSFYTDPRVPAAATQNEATAQRTNAKEAANFIFNLLCKPSGWHSDKGATRAQQK